MKEGDRKGKKRETGEREKGKRAREEGERWREKGN